MSVVIIDFEASSLLPEAFPSKLVGYWRTAAVKAT